MAMTDNIIEIRGLTKQYDGVTALEELTLAVAARILRASLDTA